MIYVISIVIGLLRWSHNMLTYYNYHNTDTTTTTATTTKRHY